MCLNACDISLFFAVPITRNVNNVQVSVYGQVTFVCCMKCMFWLNVKKLSTTFS